MLKRTIVLFSFGVAAVLFGVSQIEAQPGPKGPKGGADMQKLEKDLAQLLEAVKAISADIARIKGTDAEKKAPEKKGAEGKGFGPGGFGGGFGGFGGGRGGFGGGGFGPGGFGKATPGKAPEKIDPDTIKEKYEYYKKLYDALPKEKAKGKGFEGKGFGKGFEGKGFGKGFEGKFKGPEGKAPASTVEARIDRLIRELEELRNEVKSSKGPEPKGKAFEGKKKFGSEDE